MRSYHLRSTTFVAEGSAEYPSSSASVGMLALARAVSVRRWVAVLRWGVLESEGGSGVVGLVLLGRRCCGVVDVGSAE